MIAMSSKFPASVFAKPVNFTPKPSLYWDFIGVRPAFSTAIASPILYRPIVSWSEFISALSAISVEYGRLVWHRNLSFRCRALAVDSSAGH